MHAEAIEIALERVLESTAFRRARRLRMFLEYVVREELAGRGERLKEYAVGVSVYERGPHYDPRLDTIVRVEAIKLREKLLSYYRSEGATDPVVISMSKGSYRPTFAIHDDPVLPLLDDPDAIYEMAQEFNREFTPDKYQRALRLLQTAVARWPDNARVHAALAEAAAGATCSDIGFLAPEFGIPIMRSAAHRALALDPDNGAAHLFVGLADLRQPDKTTAMAAARRALELAPQDATLHRWAAVTLLASGKFHEALLHLRQAVRLRPGDLTSRTRMGIVLFAAGRHDEAVGLLRDVLAFAPYHYNANLWLGQALGMTGRFEEARAAIDRTFAVTGSTKALSLLGYVEARAGNTEAAEKIEVRLRGSNGGHYVHPVDLAAINVALRRCGKAAADLTHAMQDGDPMISWMKIDRRLEPLRGRVAGL